MDFLFRKEKKAEFADPNWEREQIEKAKQDPKAFGPLYEKYYKQIYLYIRKKINSNSDAEDIAAQVFEKAITNLRKFQWQGIPLSSWLYRIARNSINDYLRGIKTSKTDDNSDEIVAEMPDKSDDHLESLVKDEMQEELLQAIAQLKKIDQFIVYYKFFEGLSNTKIAEALELTESNVGTRLNRLKDKLKEYID